MKYRSYSMHWCLALCIGVLLAFAGCKGDTGPAGPTGSTGATGSQGPSGISTLDLWEDFESGTFTTYPWQLSGDANWQTTSTRKRFGDKAACSGDIDNSQVTSLSISVNLPRAGLVSFYYNISCEISWDWLRWELDGKIVDGISGSMTSDSWRAAIFAIPPGQHTVRWYYIKDGSNSVGLDCGFVDGILITNYANQKIANTIPPEGTVLWSQTDHSRRK